MKNHKKYVFLACLAVLFIVAAYFSPLLNSDGRDVRLVQLLETNVVPYIQQNNVSFYFKMDWCEGLRYGSRSVIKMSDPSTSPCLSEGTAFLEPDRIVFSEIGSLLASISIEGFREIDTEYPLTYRVEHQGLPRESIGIAFHVDCSLCRTRYVYWPHYSQLPPNIDGEITYTRINENWYRVDQDWN